MPSARSKTIPLNKKTVVPIAQPQSKSSSNRGFQSKTPITDALREMMDQEVPNDPKHRTYAESIVCKLMFIALRGNQGNGSNQGSLDAIRLIMDRIDGRVPYGKVRPSDEAPHIQWINHIDYEPLPSKQSGEHRETQELQNELPKSRSFNDDPKTVTDEKEGHLAPNHERRFDSKRSRAE